MKLKIDNEMLAEEFFEGTHLLGIVVPVRNYHFIFNVNQRMGFRFRLNTDLIISIIKKDRSNLFSVYEFPVPGCCLSHYLYHNQHDGDYLLPEFKHLDFLWLTRGEDVGGEDLKILQDQIRALPSVQLVSEMAHDKIKNKQHLIF